jgi:phage tail sheath protein FI
MPTTISYPGVYVEETPGGGRTIKGVATSITAFIGRTRRGPTNDTIQINSFGDCERSFGGLWLDSTLGYAVRDFYLNGGGQAIIVRLFHAAALEAAQDTAAATDGATVALAKAVAATKVRTFTTEPQKSASDNICNNNKGLKSRPLHSPTHCCDAATQRCKSREGLTFERTTCTIYGTKLHK